MSETCTERILGIFPLNQIIDRNLIYDQDDPKARDEIFDTHSFHNINDLSIRALLEHDPDQELATTARGTLRLWVSNRALFAEILPEVGNAVSENLFFRMKNDPQRAWGISPGYNPDFNEPITSTGERLKRIHLREISVTIKAANTGSTAVLESEYSEARVRAKVEDHEAWLREQKARINTKAKTRDEKLASTIKGFRIYLSHQRAITEAIGNTETSPMSREEIEAFKENHPYFQRFRGLGFPPGYERASFSTR